MECQANENQKLKAHNALMLEIHLRIDSIQEQANDQYNYFVGKIIEDNH
jgi:hypothetical protein